MKHFYQNIQGWAEEIPALYDLMVIGAIDNSHFVEVGSRNGGYIGGHDYWNAEVLQEEKSHGKEIK